MPIEFLRRRKLFFAVYFLFEHAEIVSDHDDFVKENLQRHFLCLECGIARMQHELALMPASTEFPDISLRLFQSQLVDGRADRFLDELPERHAEPTNRRLLARHLELAGFRIDRSEGVVETDFRRVFRNRLDHSVQILGVLYLHSNVQLFDLHAGELTQTR